jgi:hypothetical protein
MPAIEAPSTKGRVGKRLASRAPEFTELRSSSWKILTFFRQLIAEARSTSKFLQLQDTYQELRSSLDACAALADNWDSYDAAKPTRHSIEAADKFLTSLFAELFMPSRVIPSAEGGVAVYFSSGNRTAYVEYRNSREVILAMFDDHSDPIIIELTESDADESRALSLIRAYIAG